MSNAHETWSAAWEAMEQGDVRLAYDLFLRSANEGNADAQVAIGYAIEHGDFHWLDPADADLWYQRAAEQNNMCALYNIGLNKIQRGELVDAFAVMKRAYMAGEQDALVHLLELFRYSGLPAGDDVFFKAKLRTALRRRDVSDDLVPRGRALLSATDSGLQAP